MYCLKCSSHSTSVVTIRYPHDTIRIAILGENGEMDLSMMHRVLAALQSIVFVYNVKVRHVLCNYECMPPLRKSFFYRYWRNYSRNMYIVENDQNLIYYLFIYYVIFTQEYPISVQHCSPWGSCITYMTIQTSISIHSVLIQ